MSQIRLYVDEDSMHHALIAAHVHSGIVLVYRQRYSVGERLRRLLRLISAKSAEEMVNQLEYL